LVRSWKTSLWAICMAPRLSQYRSVGEDCDVSKSASSRRIHNISEVVSARARYSASVLERAVKVRFLLRQDIRESPRKIQKPVVERRSTGSPAQSASE
jgi:hypothetical protein